jgi:hypothetical protein
MKKLLLLVVLTVAALPAVAHAGDRCRDDVTINSLHCSPPARLASRVDTRDAVFAIDTEDGDATMLLTDRDVAFQLSDRTMKHVRRELRDEENEDDNAIGTAIKAVVFSTVRTMLNHSIQCRIRDVRDVDFRDGSLVFTTENGRTMFQDLDVNDHDVTRSFSESDARAFVREFRRLKRHVGRS